MLPLRSAILAEAICKSSIFKLVGEMLLSRSGIYLKQSAGNLVIIFAI